MYLLHAQIASGPQGHGDTVGGITGPVVRVYTTCRVVNIEEDQGNIIIYRVRYHNWK